MIRAADVPRLIAAHRAAGTLCPAVLDALHHATTPAAPYIPAIERAKQSKREADAESNGTRLAKKVTAKYQPDLFEG